MIAPVKKVIFLTALAAFLARAEGQGTMQYVATLTGASGYTGNGSFSLASPSAALDPNLSKTMKTLKILKALLFWLCPLVSVLSLYGQGTIYFSAHLAGNNPYTGDGTFSLSTQFHKYTNVFVLQ